MDAAHPDNHQPTVDRNARYGLILFALYVALYLGFVLLNAFAPERMQKPVMAGVNLAIVYGMGLIVAALFLALVYMVLCGGKKRHEGTEADEKRHIGTEARRHEGNRT